MLITVARGEATTAEKMQFDTWLQEAPERNRIIFEEVKKDYTDAQEVDDVAVTDTNTAFARMIAAAQRRQSVVQDTPMVTSGRKLWAPRYLKTTSVAAVLFILVGLGFWWTKTNRLNRGSNDMAAAIDWQEVTVDFGHQINLTLNDGSLVRLAPGSRFRYPRAFDQKERNVYLEGEAFFEVSRDTSRPFIVQTQNLQTRVLGTSFNIEAYGKQALEKVVVVTGKVSVSKTAGGKPELLAYLTPNKQLKFNGADSAYHVSEIPVNIVAAVKSGKLVFDGSTMQEIGEAIQRRYGVAVHFSAARIARKRLTTMLDYSSIDHLANMLSLATGLNVRHKNGHLYFNEQ